jgi:hypothetical protein
MDLKWVVARQSETGSFCTAQGMFRYSAINEGPSDGFTYPAGVLQQIGETGVALATLVGPLKIWLTHPTFVLTPQTDDCGPNIPDRVEA